MHLLFLRTTTTGEFHNLFKSNYVDKMNKGKRSSVDICSPDIYCIRDIRLSLPDNSTAACKIHLLQEYSFRSIRPFLPDKSLELLQTSRAINFKMFIAQTSEHLLISPSCQTEQKFCYAYTPPQHKILNTSAVSHLKITSKQ
ncbi:UNVERIFIED_CONTAM: hypothetical protein K2H54_020320 [Gekko kuhli]